MHQKNRFLRLFTGTGLLTLVVFLGWGIAAAAVLIREITGTNGGEIFGFSIACNQSEVLAGAPEASGLASRAGSAALIDGGSGNKTTLQYPPTPFAGVTNAQFGYSVDFLDDVNSDSLPELVVGAPGFGLGGAAFVYYDRAGPPSVEMDNLQTFSGFGASVRGMPDFFAKGSHAVLVGAPGASGTGEVKGYDGLTTNVAFTLTPPPGDSATNFGGTVGRVGDLDGDGAPDFGVHAILPGIDSVYFYSSRSRNLLVRVDETSGNIFGSSIANVGDVNGDGTPDVLIGSPKGDNSIPGSAYLYSGASIAGGSPSVLCTVSTGVVNDGFGFAVAGIGDGGMAGLEFAVSAPKTADVNFGGAGIIYIYKYSAGTCTLIDRVVSATDGDQLGSSLAGLPNSGSCDFNSDGLSDFAVGTTKDTPATDIGSVVLYNEFGPPTATPTPSPTPALTSARLSFRLDRLGSFSLHTTYNVAPPAGCDLTLYARTVVKGKRSAVRRLGRYSVHNRIMAFRLSRLPKVGLENGALGEVHMIGVTKCGTQTIQSNVFARYLNCGLGTGVSTAIWLKTFGTKFSLKYP